jgi:hypothetical protein
MNTDIIKRLESLQSGPCVSIIFNTHRTSPENEKDPIYLRKKSRDAQDELLKRYDKRDISRLLEHLDNLHENVRHTNNLDSMGVYVSDKGFEVARMPVSVENRIIIDDKFAIKELLRAIQKDKEYAVFAISRRKIRLILGNSGELLKEIKDDRFPRDNDNLYSTDKHALSMNKGTDRLHKEFINRADKDLQSFLNEHPMQVVLAGEERNRSYFNEVSDDTRHVIGFINRTREDEDAASIIRDAWNVVVDQRSKEDDKMISTLHQAQSAQKAISAPSEILRLAREGRGDTLVLERGFKLPNEHYPLPDFDSHKDKVEDIISAMLANGGSIYFVDEGKLPDYQGMGLIVRY